jgi:hypothetical protein
MGREANPIDGADLLRAVGKRKGSPSTSPLRGYAQDERI